MKNHATAMLSLVMLLGLLSGPVFADPDNSGQKHRHKHKNAVHKNWDKHRHVSQYYRNIRFDAQDSVTLRNILRNNPDLLGFNWFGMFERPVSFNPAYPHLRPGNQIPPALARQIILLPFGINQNLGLPIRNTVRIGIAGDDAVLFNPNNGLIYDALQNIR